MVRVSLGHLPSSRFFGSVFCSLSPAPSWWSKLCLGGSERGPGIMPRWPNHTGPLLRISCLTWEFDVVQGFGQLCLKDGGSGEPRKRSDLILIHLYLQERLKGEVFQLQLSEVDWAKQGSSEGLCFVSPGTLWMIKATTSTASCWGALTLWSSPARALLGRVISFSPPGLLFPFQSTTATCRGPVGPSRLQLSLSWGFRGKLSSPEQAF